MNSRKIRQKLLLSLYLEFVQSPVPAEISLDVWAQEQGLDPVFVWDVYDEALKLTGLVQEFSLQEITLTPKGVLELEGRGIPPRDLIRQQELNRLNVLKALRKIERGDWTEVAKKASVSEPDCDRAIKILEYQGFARRRTVRVWEITLSGREYIESNE